MRLASKTLFGACVWLTTHDLLIELIALRWQNGEGIDRVVHSTAARLCYR